MGCQSKDIIPTSMLGGEEGGGKIFLGKEGETWHVGPDGVTEYLVERGYGVLERRFAGLRLAGPPPSSNCPGLRADRCSVNAQ